MMSAGFLGHFNSQTKLKSGCVTATQTKPPKKPKMTKKAVTLFYVQERTYWLFVQRML